ncbi:hypothetical protein WG909_06880 [Peptostreptococcaceae bacterium AGR-M142]
MIKGSKKNFVKILFIILTTFLFSGCIGIVTPEELLQKPKIEPYKVQIKNAVDTYMPTNGKLAIPYESKGGSSVNLVDLDGDDKEEVVVFYEAMKEYYQIGAFVLKDVDGYFEVSNYIQGDGIFLLDASFIDLTGDDNPELLMGWYNGKDKYKTLDIYTFKNDNLRKIDTINYTSFEIGDLDNDLENELYAIKVNKEEDEALVEQYKLDENLSLVKTAYINTNSFVDNVSKSEIANMTKNKKALFIDYDVANSGYTNIITYEDNMLKKVFDDRREKIEEIKTFQTYPLGSFDIDDDGIMEIGIPKPITVYSNENLRNKVFIRVWYEYNDGLNPKAEYYIDFEQEYKILLPQFLYGKFTIETNERNFYHETKFIYTGKDVNYNKELFTLAKVNKDRVEEVRNIFIKEGRTYDVLGRNSRYVFFKLNPNLNEYKYRAFKESHENLLKRIDLKDKFEILKD